MEQQQLPLQWGASGGVGKGETQAEPTEERQIPAAPKEDQPGKQNILLKAVARDNLLTALQKVRANKGAPGIDGMTVDELPGYLKANWLRIKQELLDGTYRPAPVRQVIIPKPGGGKRELGIPTVLDRFIQQAILQVLTPVFEPTFADESYGFRPKRCAHHAVLKAKQYAEEGYNFVADMDITKFFDHVNHDILMHKLAKVIGDKQLLRLIRRYLNSGILVQGLVMCRVHGTPQGGPLSPLLANVYLTELDAELIKRGHRFIRYADDCNVYVRSEKAAKRVMQSITAFLEKTLRLEVNESKSATGHVWERPFLGFTFNKRLHVWLAKGALKRAKARIKHMTERSGGRSFSQVIAQLNQYLTGWVNYYALVHGPTVFEDLDKWIRRRLRCLLWKQWKRHGTRRRELAARGVTGRALLSAYTSKGLWRTSRSITLSWAMPKSYFADQGLVSLLDMFKQLRVLRTAGCV